MIKHIGIVGVSPEGAALFIRELSRQSHRIGGPNAQLRVSMHNEPLAGYLNAIRLGDWHGVAALLSKSAEVVAAAGAEVCVTPDHAVQYALHLAEHETPIPWRSMPEAVADAIAREGRSTVGLIGTRWVTAASTYQTHLGLRGIQVLSPDGDEAEDLDRIIVDELLKGEVRTSSREKVRQIIRNLEARGCEGIVLASSEAPLAVEPGSNGLSVYDAGSILAEAVVRDALSLAGRGEVAPPAA
ncbi:MAG: hypothetical protein EA423_12625 [Phycisphaerales bacterium]|nr:MAG: hypothetical protein EA423_12625 [Phycisphaerales bacterium]